MADEPANQDADQPQEGEPQAQAPDADPPADAGDADPPAQPDAGEGVEAQQPAASDAAADDAASGSGDAGALAEEALKAAQQAVAEIGADTDDGDGPAASTQSPGQSQSGAPLTLPDLAADHHVNGADEAIDLLADVNLDVRIELGRTTMLVEDVLKLSEGAVVELDKLAGDPVDVFVNDRHVARGEVLILNDNFCVRVSEITASKDDDE